MRLFSILFIWTVFIFSDTLAQLGFKVGSRRLPADAFTALWWRMTLSSMEIWVSTGALLIAFICWLAILRQSKLGLAFAASSLTLVTVVASSALWLDEPFSLTEGLGSLLILLGVYLLQEVSPKLDGPSPPGK